VHKYEILNHAPCNLGSIGSFYEYQRYPPSKVGSLNLAIAAFIAAALTGFMKQHCVERTLDLTTAAGTRNTYRVMDRTAPRQQSLHGVTFLATDCEIVFSCNTLLVPA
jgi:hypothetical protein